MTYTVQDVLRLIQASNASGVFKSLMKITYAGVVRLQAN